MMNVYYIDYGNHFIVYVHQIINLNLYNNKTNLYNTMYQLYFNKSKQKLFYHIHYPSSLKSLSSVHINDHLKMNKSTPL